MKLFYSTLRKHFFLAGSLLTLFTWQAKAQVLSAGDIAFTSYNSTDNSTDRFSFVLLVNIPSGTVINFTDNGWLSSNVFRTGEQTVTWTAGSALVAGREITISGPGSGAATAVVSGSSISAGTCTGTMPSLSVNGDQIIAYQGTVASPTILTALHMNVYVVAVGDPTNTDATNWDGTANAAPASAKPPTLTTGTNALWIGTTLVQTSERNNAEFNCNGPLASVAQVRAAVNNQANWNSEFAASGAIPTWIPPSGCAFLASIFPVDIISFTGNNESSFIALKWQTANEAHDNGRFELEKSADGQNFSRIGTVNAQGFSYLYNNYSYNDMNPLQGANFYRLKISSANGEVKYSAIVKVLFGKSGKAVIITPTTASSDITVSFTGNKFNQLAIADMTGRIVLTERLTTNNQRINISRLPAGQYTVSLMGAAQKVTEKIVIVK